MVSDSSHCARQTAPRGHETKPFLWGNRSFILISKMHFFFFLRKKEIEIIHSCSSHWTLDEKAFLQDEMGAVLPQTGCARLLLHPPCGQKSSRLGRIKVSRDALIPSQSSSHGSTFRADLMLSVFHHIPVL